MTRFFKAANKKISPYYIIAAILILWQVAPSLNWVNPYYLPSFSTVILSIFQVTVPGLLMDVLISLERIFIGFAVAVIAAVPLGFLLAGAFPKVARFLNSLMSFFSQIPPFILFPIFVVVFGVGEKGIYTVIIWSIFWPVLFATIGGTRQIDPMLIKCARSMNSDHLAMFLKVIIPGAFPDIMTGIRSGITLGFMMLIGAESLGAVSGLGWLVLNSQKTAQVPLTYLAALLIAVVGLAVNYIFELVERQVVVWNGDQRSVG